VPIAIETAAKNPRYALRRPSVVNVAQVLTVDKAKLSERLGRLPVVKVDAIRRGLHLLFDRV